MDGIPVRTNPEKVGKGKAGKSGDLGKCSAQEQWDLLPLANQSRQELGLLPVGLSCFFERIRDFGRKGSGAPAQFVGHRVGAHEIKRQASLAKEVPETDGIK